MVEKIRHRIEIVVIFSGLLACFMFPLLAILSIIAHRQGLILATITYSVPHDAGANLAFSTWIAMTGEGILIEVIDTIIFTVTPGDPRPLWGQI